MGLIVAVLGCLLAVAGVGLWSVPAALIAAGLFVLGFAALLLLDV